MAQKMSDNVAKFMDDTRDERHDPPGKELVVSNNLFSVDDEMVNAMNILDMDQMDRVMEKWRQGERKKLKKGPRVAVEFRPEDTTEVFIGDTLISEDQKSSNQSSKSLEPLPTKPQISDSSPDFGEPKSLPITPPATGESTGKRISLPSILTPTNETADDLGTRMEVKLAEETKVATQGILKAPPIRQTINMILVDQPYVLEWYKSLEDKRELLKEAIGTHDGNTIITVVLFLRKTLSKSLFEALLLNNPVAANHYCSFLRQNEAWEQLKSVYYVQGEETFGILQYQLCLTNENMSSRISSLESCRMLFSEKPILAKEAMYIEEYIKLLKRQKLMEEIKEKKPVSAVKKYQGPPLIDTTIITTLTYCCRYHLVNPEAPEVSPEEFKKDFSVSERQYFVTLLVSLCANRDWETIDHLLTPKGWQSKLKRSNKLKAPIPVERVVNIIAKSRFRAPEDMLSKYIRMIDDLEKRFEIATRFECYGVGVEVLKQFKDNKRLKSYLSQIPVDKQRKYRPLVAKMFS